MNDYSKYLDLLDNVIEEEKETTEEEDKECCNNPDIVMDNIYCINICQNCGITSDLHSDDYELDYQIESHTFTSAFMLNKKFKLSTTMNYGGSKYYKLKRIHKWGECDYKEITASNRFEEINNIGEKLNISKKDLTRTHYLYKDIYDSCNISTRGKITKSLYLYCLYFIKDFNIDILTLIKDNDLTTSNYNTAMKHLDNNKDFDYNILYLHKKMKYFHNLFEENYFEINIQDIINNYNLYLIKYKDTKFSVKTILLSCFYYYIKDNEDYNITFSTIFKTTEDTITNKLLKIID